jgi:hypothetical protein
MDRFKLTNIWRPSTTPSTIVWEICTLKAMRTTYWLWTQNYHLKFGRWINLNPRQEDEDMRLTEQNHVGCLLRNVWSWYVHGDAKIRLASVQKGVQDYKGTGTDLLECRCIIYTIASTVLSIKKGGWDSQSFDLHAYDMTKCLCAFHCDLSVSTSVGRQPGILTNFEFVFGRRPSEYDLLLLEYWDWRSDYRV